MKLNDGKGCRMKQGNFILIPGPEIIIIRRASKLRLVNENIHKIQNILVSYQKVRTSVINDDEKFKRYINTINQINSLKDTEIKFRDHLLTEWKLPKLFKWSIVPKKVAIIDAYEAADIIDRSRYRVIDESEQTIDETLMNIDEFNNYSVAINIAYRKQGNDLLSVGDLRQYAQLDHSIMKRMIKDNKTGVVDQLPIELKDIKLYESYVYTNDVSEVLSTVVRLNAEI